MKTTSWPLPEAWSSSAPGPSNGGSGRAALGEEASWLTDVGRRHVHVALIVTLLIVAATRIGRLPAGYEPAILVLAVGILGLPHGALDYLSGRALLARRFGRAWPVPFVAGYLGLAGIVLLGWTLVPVVTLVSFLAVAAAHFGLEDTDSELALGAGTRLASFGLTSEALTRGALLVASVVFFHPAEAAALFGYLIPSRAIEVTAGVNLLRVPLALVVFTAVGAVLLRHVVHWLRGSEAHGLVAAEIACLAALFALTPPLIAFVVYFCAWHSVRHTLEVASRLDPLEPRVALQTFARRAWPLTAVTIALGTIAFLALTPVQPPGPAMIRVVFVGLSALTVPHILFSWAAERASAAEGASRRNHAEVQVSSAARAAA